MGLIKAAALAASSVLKDQWKEYFYCDAIPQGVIAVKGSKKKSGISLGGEDNIISNGSGIVVNEGQCMLIVDNGQVVDLCAVPGQYTYDQSTEPSVFDGGNLADNIKEVFKNIGKRFTYGGVVPKDQRVYYFNVKEMVGNKFGTATPVPFRVVDERAGIDIDMGLRCYGEYSIKLANPILFYTNICGNFKDSYKFAEIEDQMRVELIAALQPAFAEISKEGIRYSQLPAYSTQLAALLNDQLSEKWGGLRGVEIVSCNIASVTVTEEDEKLIKEMQRNAAFTDPSRAAAYMVGSTGEAMKAAANNASGAFTGFAGMNMANAMGGVNANELFNSADKQKDANTWTCSCGAINSGNFCTSCGAKKPGSWTCKCGTINEGNFCANCGEKKA